ncbi:hypothetical protein DFP72DRAFT_852236 [Ephemerocybe angulata]|uniref:Uncharacterized protein n=1 Tax=Ephemerocybe angulata TaxID=980116 RepID=A0A8H6M2Y3_9AGAR|nr:hypothetical protein DFP72DRAFT_852236 [Tulosesus angulatus]
MSPFVEVGCWILRTKTKLKLTLFVLSLVMAKQWQCGQMLASANRAVRIPLTSRGYSPHSATLLREVRYIIRETNLGEAAGSGTWRPRLRIEQGIPGPPYIRLALPKDYEGIFAIARGSFRHDPAFRYFGKVKAECTLSSKGKATPECFRDLFQICDAAQRPDNCRIDASQGKVVAGTSASSCSALDWSSEPAYCVWWGIGGYLDYCVRKRNGWKLPKEEGQTGGRRFVVPAFCDAGYFVRVSFAGLLYLSTPLLNPPALHQTSSLFPEFHILERAYSRALTHPLQPADSNPCTPRRAFPPVPPPVCSRLSRIKIVKAFSASNDGRRWTPFVSGYASTEDQLHDRPQSPK